MTDTFTKGDPVVYYVDKDDEFGRVGTVVRTYQTFADRVPMVTVWNETRQKTDYVPQTQASVVTRYRPTVTFEDVMARAMGAK